MMAEGKSRKKNFLMDEVRVLRENWAANSEYLQSPFSNKVTNAGKNKIWAEITSAINALGHEVRTPTEIRHKWKNVTAVAKTTFSEFKKNRNRTGGGPPPLTPSSDVMKTIDLLKDSVSFRVL